MKFSFLTNIFQICKIVNRTSSLEGEITCIEETVGAAKGVGKNWSWGFGELLSAGLIKLNLRKKMGGVGREAKREGLGMWVMHSVQSASPGEASPNTFQG